MGLTLIPLNMAEPVLITRDRRAAGPLGFAPHGAGQNISRSAFLRAHLDVPSEEPLRRDVPDVDLRSYCGALDVSELPGPDKNAASVRAQIPKLAGEPMSRRGCARGASAPSRGSNEGSAGAVS